MKMIRPSRDVVPHTDLICTLETLQAQLAAPPSERTARLVRATTAKKARKLVEEATEVALDAVAGNAEGLIAESVDLLYHLAVIWHDRGIAPEAIRAEMSRRAVVLGIVEKRPKKGPGKKALKALEKAPETAMAKADARPDATAPRSAMADNGDAPRLSAFYRDGDLIGPVRMSEMQRF